MTSESANDKRYVDIFTGPLKECLNYRPKFGHSTSEGFTLEEFLILYQNDPFYNWIGLDSPFLYAAHKAAGGMTSIYRQTGIGCERLFRAILVDRLGYNSEEDALWSYNTTTKSGKEKTLYLDGFINLNKISDTEIQIRVKEWIREFALRNGLPNTEYNGIVIEVRQGYKSKDSKRQNADIDNATVAYAYGLIPVFTIFSTQIDDEIILRYKNNKCGVLIGNLTDDPFISFYAFCKSILQYDLAEFFRRNADIIRQEIQNVLKTLLSY